MSAIGDIITERFRNERENQEFHQNMVKAGALIVAALEAHEKGYC